MRRATTPVHSFTFPFDPEQLTKILLTYSQNDEVILNKTKEDFTFEGNVGTVTLSQEETNLFDDTPSCGEYISNASVPMVDVQIRALTTSEQAIATDIWRIPLRKILNDEVL